MPLKLCKDIAVMEVEMIRTYSELSKLKTFRERFEYLKLDSVVGQETFGPFRYLNQKFYSSQEWLSAKDYIISRDNGCDLGLEGYEIHSRIIVHHLNPITISDIKNHTYALIDPDNLITTILNTHNAIHYSDSGLLLIEPIVRTKNDTCPWKGS